MPNAKLKMTNDFSGAIDSFSAPDAVADNACRDMVNFIPGRAGDPLPMRPGTSLFTTIPLDAAPVTGICSYVKRDADRIRVAVVGNKLVSYDSSPTLGEWGAEVETNVVTSGETQMYLAGLVDGGSITTTGERARIALDLVAGTTGDVCAVRVYSGATRITTQFVTIDHASIRDYYTSPEFDLVAGTYSLKLSSAQSDVYCFIGSGTANRKVYEQTQQVSSSVVLKTLSAAGDATFAVMNDNLYVANGSEAIVKWNGDTATASALTNAPTVTMVVNIHDRLFAAGSPTNPSRLYCSGVVSKDTSWAGSLGDDGGSVDIRVDDGTVITGIAEFMGGAVIFKERAVYLLTWSSGDNPAIDGKVDTLVPGVGCISHHTIRAYNGTILFLGRDSMGAVSIYQLTTSGVNNIALSIPIELGDITLGQKPHAEIYENRYHLAFSIDGTSVRDHHLVCDLLRTRWYKFEGFDVRCWGTDPQSDSLYFGSADGTVRQAYDGTTDCGAPIAYRWRSKDFNASNPFSEKRWREVYFDLSRNYDSVMAGVINDNSPATVRRLYVGTVGGSWWGAVEWGAFDWSDGAEWAHIGFDPNIRSRSLAVVVEGTSSAGLVLSHVGVAYRDGKTRYLHSTTPPDGA